MSYTIVYDKKFVKTAHGIIPIVLSGCSNLYRTNLKGKDVLCRSWGAFRNSGLPASAEEIMAEVHKSLPSTYNQHFKYSSRWVDDKGLVSFFESGIRNALTLEEMTRKYIVFGLSVDVLAHEVGTGKDYPPSRHVFSKYCRTNDELDDALEHAIEAFAAQPEEARPYFEYSFGKDERLKPFVRTHRTYGAKEEMGYLILLENGCYFIRRSSRRMWSVADAKNARVFRSQDEAVKYVHEGLCGYEIANKAIIMQKTLVVCTSDYEQYWAGRGFVMSDTFAKTYNTQAQAEKALAQAVLVNSNAIIHTTIFKVVTVEREHAAAAI
jgi:hypothetical protein